MSAVKSQTQAIGLQLL